MKTQVFWELQLHKLSQNFQMKRSWAERSTSPRLIDSFFSIKSQQTKTMMQFTENAMVFLCVISENVTYYPQLIITYLARVLLDWRNSWPVSWIGSTNTSICLPWKIMINSDQCSNRTCNPSNHNHVSWERSMWVGERFQCDSKSKWEQRQSDYLKGQRLSWVQPSFQVIPRLHPYQTIFIGNRLVKTSLRTWLGLIVYMVGLRNALCSVIHMHEGVHSCVGMCSGVHVQRHPQFCVCKALYICGSNKNTNDFLTKSPEWFDQTLFSVAYRSQLQMR